MTATLQLLEALGDTKELYVAKLISAALILISLRLLYSARNGPLSHLPGPEVSKWTGWILAYHWLAGRRVDYVHSLHRIHGPVVRVSPSEVSICETEAAKTIHKVGSSYPKAPFYRDLVPLGVNVFASTDQKAHAERRRLLASPISDSSLMHFDSAIVRKVRMAVSGMSDEMETRGCTDIFKWWLFMATDVIGELTFGDSFRMLESGEKNQYARDLEQISGFQPFRTTFPLLVKLSKYVPLPVFKTIAASGRRMGMYAQESIGRYQKLVSEDPDKPRQTLFSKLFADQTLTPAEITYEAQGYIVAGSDTTAVSLTYLVYALCKHDKIRQQLVEEVGNLSEAFSDHDLRALPYLNNVINEALRLYSAAPSALPRIAPPSGASLAGAFVPGGTVVSTQAYSLHRMANVFPNPEKFDPDRWVEPTKAMKDTFMPFGGGSRTCLGIHLAKKELRLATAHFFRRFSDVRVSTKEGMSDDEMTPATFFLMAPQGHRCLIAAT